MGLKARVAIVPSDGDVFPVRCFDRPMGHCRIYGAVHLFQRLQGESPENGSFIEFGWRLSGGFAKKFENDAVGDFQQSEKPAIGGPFCCQRRKFSETRNAWLATQC